LNIFEKINIELLSDIERVNSLILENIQVPEDLVNDITNYVLKRKGKKIRPIITLLTAKMIQNHINDEAIYLACAVELVHIATLLHDDVIDSAIIRNGQTSPNKIWDNKVTVLAGDFLFSQAFKFMVKAKSLIALDLLSSASAIIAEGEISQAKFQKQSRIITEEEYFNIIEKKTAKLFSSASACGAIAAFASSDLINKMDKFAFLFGTIFQISDDFLDYFGSSSNLGKEIGADFFENKITLPVIIAYNKSNEEERNFWEIKFFEHNKSKKDLDYAINLLNKYNVENNISNIMNNIKKEAIDSLCDIYPDNFHKNLLIELIEFVVTRTK
jgi:octaprenyl-diphosphate synthase